MDAIGQAGTDEGFLEHAGLRAGAVEHGEVAVAAAAIEVLAHAVHHELGLVVLIEGGIELDGCAVVAVGPKFLPESSEVAGDEPVGGTQNGAGGAVVLLQADHFAAREVAGQSHHVLDARTAPAVDRLIVITHREHHAVGAGQQPQPLVLQVVGVLELIDQHMAEAGAVVGLNVGYIAAQFEGAQQQLREIHQTGLLALVLVGLIDPLVLALGVVAGVHQVTRAQPFVLAGVDPAGHRAGRPLLLRHVQLLQQPLDHALLVVGIEDLEVLRQPRLLPVQAQHAVGDAVKGADPQRADRDPDQLFDAAPHLGGRLVGEGDRQDRLRSDPFEGHQPGDAVGQHPGLARAGAGQHQTVGRRCRHRLRLGRIEVAE